MKTVVYIDGQNFLYKAAEVLIVSGKIREKHELVKIDITGIVKGIVTDENVMIRFYSAKVKLRKDKGDEIHQKSRQFSDTSRRLRNTLNNQSIEYIENGKLKLRDSDVCKNCGAKDLRFQEKGVDVGIAVDMIEDSYDDDVQKLVLISSDTDLIPAIKSVKRRNKQVIYIGFSDKLTNGIVAEASSTQTIRNQEIIDAFDSLNPPTLLLDQDLSVTETE